MTQAKKEEGKEIFPDEENIINNKFELEWYLDEIYKDKEEFEAAKFNPNDSVFEEQKQYLNTIPKEEFQKLHQLFEPLKKYGSEKNFMSSDTFQELHEMLYEMKLIFSYKWMAWHKGWKIINDTNFDYSKSSLLDISMYLTAIFRADRFSNGTIEQNFKNGTLDKIFTALR